jgi:hypothetical protein
LNFTDAYNPKVAGLVDPQLQYAQQDALIDATLVKVVGAILGTQASTQKKAHLPLMTLSKYMTKTLILKK